MKNLEERGTMKLNLGCGRHQKQGYVNLDLVEMPGVDVVHDLGKFPYPFKDDTFVLVEAFHVLEHLPETVKVMKEIHRISKPGAIIKIEVPHYHSHGAFQDPTHKSFFTLSTFDYFSDNTFFHYYAPFKFKILKKKLIPTRLGKFFPGKIREKLSMVFGEIARSIYFELKVIK